MTCRGKLDIARRHAELVEQVETCAPPVTAPYLAAAYERMRSGAAVWYLPEIRKHATREVLAQEQWIVFDGDGELRDWGFTPAEATRAYLDLCDSLSPDLSSSQGETAGPSCPATLSRSAEPFRTTGAAADRAGVGFASASVVFSRSAARVPSAHSPADERVAPTDNGALAASPLIPGEAATFPVTS
jgi:hypothetical protein